MFRDVYRSTPYRKDKMSAYGCIESQLPKRNNDNTCVFRGVSTCNDHISHLICNAHLKLFGLINKLSTYKTDSGDSWPKINLYAYGDYSFSLPAFVNNNGVVLMNEVHQFIINVCSRFKDLVINTSLFQARIAYLLSLSLENDVCEYRDSWLSDESTSVIIRTTDGTVNFSTMIKPLHKILFYYAGASNVINRNNGSSIYLIPNISLTYNGETNGYLFMVPNRSLLLKYTEDEGCVASPIILDSFKHIQQQSKERSFRAADVSTEIC